MRKNTMIAALLLAFSAQAHAVEVEPCGPAYQSALDDGAEAEQMWPALVAERESGCILGPTDNTGIRKLYLDLGKDTSGVEVAVTRAELFRRLLQQFDGIPDGACPGDPTGCMVGLHKKAIGEVRDLLATGDPDPKDPRLALDHWAVVVRDGRIAAGGIALKPYLDQECAEDVKSARCRAAFELAARIARGSEATFQAIVAHRLPLIEANTQFLTRRDREWNAYFNEVSVQYPWELAFNSWKFVGQTPAGERGKFPRAPESKYIVLHPSPGFEYADVGGEKGTQAAVVVELFGYERWRWRDGNATGRYGASLAASFADVPGADPVGYGVVLHLPFRNITVGAIWRDGDAGDSINLTVNADLAKLIQQYKDVDVKDFVLGKLKGTP